MMVSSHVAEEAVLWRLKYAMDSSTVMTALMRKTAVRKPGLCILVVLDP